MTDIADDSKGETAILALSGLPSYEGKVDRHFNPLASTIGELVIVCSKIHPKLSEEIDTNISYRLAPTNYEISSAILEFFLAGYLLARKDFDCIIAVSLFPRGIYAFILGKIFRKPVHMRIIGADIPVHSKTWYRRIPLSLFRRFDSVSVHGPAHKKFLINHGVNSNDIHIVPGSIDLERYNRDSTNDAIYDFIWVGAMRPNKRPQLFVEALECLKKEGYQFRALMVGDGVSRSKVESKIISAGLSDRIDRPGWVDENEIPSYLSKADIFVLTSWREGFGFPLVEAMASGLACIAPKFSDPANGNTSYIINNGHDGILISDLTSPRLANQMKVLQQDDRLKESLSKNARTSMKKFSKEKMTERWKQVLIQMDVFT